MGLAGRARKRSGGEDVGRLGTRSRCLPTTPRFFRPHDRDSGLKKENAMRKRALLGCLVAAICLHATEASAQPATVATGNFTGIAHKTTGKALILQTADGGHVLRLENFHTSNGPDVRVYL